MMCLKNTFMFYNMTDSELENLRDNMLYCEVAQNTLIYDESMQGHCFFIVEKGSL